MEKSPGLCKAILECPRSIPKDSRNYHAKYDYASADAVFQSVAKPLAEAGLATWINEVSVDVVEGKKGADGKEGPKWVKTTYEIALTPGGLAPPDGKAERVTVMAQLLSAQTLQAVRTYAIKYFLRTKLLLATGEIQDDVDNQPKGTPTQAATKATKKKTKTWLDEKTNLVCTEGFFGSSDEEIIAKGRLLWNILKESSGNLDFQKEVMNANAAWFNKLNQKAQNSILDLLKKQRDDKVAEGKTG